MLIDEGDDLALHLSREHHANNLHGLRGRDAQPAAEFAGNAHAIEHRRDLRSSPVHDDGAQSGETQEDDVLGEGALERVIGHGIAAVLHDHRGATESLEPRQCLGEHGCLLLRRHVEYAEFSWT